MDIRDNRPKWNKCGELYQTIQYALSNIDNVLKFYVRHALCISYKNILGIG